MEVTGLGWASTGQRRQGWRTEVRPASQAGGKQGIRILCLQKDFQLQKASSFPSIRALHALQVGTGSLDSSRLYLGEPEANELFAISFLKENLKDKECLCGSTPISLEFHYCHDNTSKKHFLHIFSIMCFFSHWQWNKLLNCGSALHLINVIQGLPQTVCHLLLLLIRSWKVFICPNLQSHAQDGALLKAGLLANTVNEVSTAKMSMVIYLVRKGLIYLVQLPSVIFMEMSEQQSGEMNGNKDDY